MKVQIIPSNTGLTDVTGRSIHLGDTVGYDEDGDDTTFVVVFEAGTYRKQYEGWDNTLPKPTLDDQFMADLLRYKIIARRKTLFDKYVEALKKLWGVDSNDETKDSNEPID